MEGIQDHVPIAGWRLPSCSFRVLARTDLILKIEGDKKRLAPSPLLLFGLGAIYLYPREAKLKRSFNDSTAFNSSCEWRF